MPIYAYKCVSCGYAKDVLQKLSDAPLVVCPQCGQSAFHKQVTAAGFQLKGSGWYVTDFRGGGSSPANADGKAESRSDPARSSEAGASEAKGGESGGGSTNPAQNGGAPLAASAQASTPSSSGGAAGGG